MKITIFGSGYVGLVTGACFAEVGNDVLCVDVDPHKVAMLQRGEIPIHEPGLDEVVRRNSTSGRLRFTTEVAEGVAHGLFQFIAVGTPPDEDGSADLQHVRAVARSIGQHLQDYRVVIDKSTVPVGTAGVVRETIAEILAGRGQDIPFSVVSNPEFLKEGAAVADFMRPDRIIVGNDDHRATLLLRNLYAPFNRNHDRLIEMDVRSAELTKYAANAMLATKISFMNEMANLAERLGADIEKVRIGIGADPRIGYHFIYPGAGYGGSCFPKDVKALEYTARSVNYQATLLQAVEAVNARQKTVLFTKIQRHFQNKLQGRTFTLWGLAFKPGTDDMREAPSRVLLEALWREGCTIRAYDPAAMSEARRLYGERPDFQLCDRPMDALSGADALVIITEWSLFRSPDFEAIRQTLKQPVIFDGRNLYDPEYLREQGFVYYAIGRGEKA
ncbi:MAG TPA: UDP-glucose/GDP-mannose dehydrogenase family protein [Candidatus Competibacteraceae bacterium]|nr:UDP-glucose/GDP-mannose dehydrogenase family protein [Candidatus Competibacteraceae bacterium]MCP5135057.1 UDP-glucose/GDP-mannose dehydrogenase family protein [Gammaproteobacteria bacterium]HPF59395.1 UDP-glucose/GDP-mannose dehydrogenase family protein [Candidatus Competibacteraceae bacterium]HRY18900.1 UDP-glucose/GDP-mannose dehydrogenase family protein [Candidatus Competibacteraceae bacterium]